MDEHLLPKRLKCNFCHVKFRTDRDLNYHKSKHNANAPPKVELTNVQKTSAQTNVTGIEGEKFQCYICTRT